MESKLNTVDCKYLTKATSQLNYAKGAFWEVQINDVAGPFGGFQEIEK